MLVWTPDSWCKTTCLFGADLNKRHFIVILIVFIFNEKYLTTYTLHCYRLICVRQTSASRYIRVAVAIMIVNWISGLSWLDVKIIISCSSSQGLSHLKSLCHDSSHLMINVVGRWNTHWICGLCYLLQHLCFFPPEA